MRMWSVRTIRLGILGAARITRTALMIPSRQMPGVEITAIGARDQARALAQAERFRIPHAHAGYSAVLDDPDIDAIYIPLPASLHAPWTLAAIDAGKHVLVEKPFTGNAETARLVAARASDATTVVMEAYHSGLHPLHERLREIVGSGELGKIHHARGTFGVPIPPGRDIRWNVALGGGGLLDVGYYPVRTLREVLGGPASVLEARAWTRGAIDRLLIARIDIGGVAAEIVSSIWSRHIGSRVEITGDLGRLRVSWPYQPQHGAAIRVTSTAGSRVERVERTSTYALQLTAFREVVAGRALVVNDARAGVAQLEVIDAIYRAAGMEVRP